VELVDIGVNLTNRAFRKDRDVVIANARAAGVVGVIVTGTSESESEAAAAMARSRPGLLYATAGVHPHDARHWRTETRERLKSLANATEVVAVGETGLDFNRDFSPRPAQERVFAAQLELAAEVRAPVFMHERDAHERLIGILKEYRDRLEAVVIHCFTGSRSELFAYLDLGLHVGITGWICDERRGSHLRELVRSIPLDRLMIETDAPYLLPRDLKPRPKSRRNEPAFLPHVAQAIAACRDIPVAVLADVTTGTAKKFFRIP
jgi:TatD DNase family protein